MSPSAKPHSGVVLLRLGMVQDACCPGIHMLLVTAKRLGFQDGDYLQLDVEERSTSVVRQLVGCNRGCSGMRRDYVYIDPLSFHYLDAGLHAPVRIRRAEYPLECP